MIKEVTDLLCPYCLSKSVFEPSDMLNDTLVLKCSSDACEGNGTLWKIGVNIKPTLIKRIIKFIKKMVA